jgi:hypothetical protein
MAETAAFCRARQPFCFRAEPVPQVALLYSTASHYREMNGLFSRDLTRLRGTLQALLESQYSVEVLSEHNLAGRMAQYPLIVVPETDYLEPAFREELLAYARNGGNLLLIGPSAAGLFAEALGATLQGGFQGAARYLAVDGARVPTKGPSQAVTLKEAKPFGLLFESTGPDAAAQSAASIASLGKGRIAATYFSFSAGYIAERSAAARAFLRDLAHELFPQPLVEVVGSPDVDVTINRMGGRLAINLVNTAGPHADVQSPIHDSVPPVGPLELRLRTAKAPTKLSLEPGGERLAFDYQDGVARFTLPSLAIHRVVLVD